MLRNSFKFLSLALAASLITAPILAVNWDSNSTKGLVDLAVATVGIVCVVAYNYFSSKNSKPEPVILDENNKTVKKESFCFMDGLKLYGYLEYAINHKTIEPFKRDDFNRIFNKVNPATTILINELHSKIANNSTAENFKKEATSLLKKIRPGLGLIFKGRIL